MHPEKAFEAITDKLAGRNISVKLVQPINVPVPINVRLTGKFKVLSLEQPANAEYEIPVSPSPNSIVSKFEQLLKQKSLIIDRLPGILIFVNPVHKLKVLYSRVANPEGNSIVVIDLQPLNANCDMVFRLLGSEFNTNPGQFINAIEPIDFSSSGIIIELNFVQFAKALDSIAVTPVGKVIDFNKAFESKDLIGSAFSV